MSTVHTPTTARPGVRPPVVTAVAVTAAGPLAIAILRGILPYDTVDDATTVVVKVSAAPGTQAAVLGLTYVALLTLPLGLVLAGRVAVAARPVLGVVAAVVSWLGFMSLFAGVGYDYVAYAGAAAGVPVPVVATMGAALDASPATSLPLSVFVPGHILGAILLAAALWRVIPRWASAALAVSQPLHLVFAVFVPNHALDAAAWSLTAVGLAAAAAAGTRQGRR